MEDCWTEPPSNEAAQFGSRAYRLTWIRKQGLHSAQGHLSKFMKRSVVEAVKLPIDIEALKYR